MASNSELNHRTLEFAKEVADLLILAGFQCDPVFASGNIIDGPGWIVEATDKDGTLFNIEIAGPPYEASDA